MKLPLENPKVMSEYGVWRVIKGKNNFHKGIDLISLTGNRNVRAIADGRVSFCGYDKSFGNYVSILHNDLKKSLYCHLKSFNVAHGQAIKEGDLIGIEGNTGNSTGVHLHLEIRVSPYRPSNHIDVAEYLGIVNKKGKVEKLKEEDDEMSVIKRLIDEYGEEAVEKGLRKMIESANDDGLPAGWAIEELDEAQELGITDGTRPEMYATRQETAIMVKRALKPTHENP